MSKDQAESDVQRLIGDGKRANVWQNRNYTEEYGVYYS